MQIRQNRHGESKAKYIEIHIALSLTNSYAYLIETTSDLWRHLVPGRLIFMIDHISRFQNHASLRHDTK